ncbi:MAG: archease [Longimicrobiales bacterium]
MAAPRLRYLEHTADLGFEIDADTLTDLFQCAAAGLFELLLGRQTASRAGTATETTVLTLHLQAEEPGLLLAAWLRELLFWYETTGLRLARSKFTVLTERELAAELTGVPAGRAARREIKAVTYHQLFVRPHDGAWRARVIFDV